MRLQKKTKIIAAALGIMVSAGIGWAVFAMNSRTYADSPQESKAAEASDMEVLTFRGTEYYCVTDESQLRAIGTEPYGLDKNYMQQADISLSDEEWVPIGTEENPFTGSYNGNGCKITGLTMTDPETKIIGFFGYAREAHIYNVTMEELDIREAGSKAFPKSAGAICALAEECRIYDNVVHTKNK